MISEIIHNLYVGDFQDAKDLPKQFVSINVAYEHLQSLPNSLYLPFFTPAGDNKVAISGIVLNALAEIIERYLEIDRAVVVNCNMGMERSPLTVVWFLMRRRGMSLDEAYALVKKGRPQTLDRREWLAGLSGI